ncbi:MAG: hypothetical protein AAF799_36990 [Myxococcota bacterium]
MKMRITSWAKPIASTIVALGTIACGGDDTSSNNPLPTGITSLTAGSMATTTGGTVDDDDTVGAIPDIGGDDTGPGGDTEGCAEVSDQAMVGIQPADILFVVDNSGSMGFEALSVQNNLNAFSTQIFLANIDARVALISADSSDDEGICVGQPLGTGSCPADENPPGYVHVVDAVGSNNALDKIIQHYDSWSVNFRPTAAKHVVVVSDDDADMDAGTFDTMFRALDPSLEDYTFHAIASPEGLAIACVLMTSCCLTAADAGEEYIALTNLTGGVFGNLCDQDFQPVFDQISQAVVTGATLACEYDIPVPPDGEDFDPDQVNVEFDDGAGGGLDIGRVEDPAECANVSHGWYYDDPENPTSIVVCPQTCTQIQGFNMASVSIKFGCATVPAA